MRRYRRGTSFITARPAQPLGAPSRAWSESASGVSSTSEIPSSRGVISRGRLLRSETHSTHGSDRLGQRAAFTLIELMVVITIIAVIMSLTAGAYFKFIGSQKQSNTVLLAQKISNALKQHWQAVIDQARTETIPSDVTSWAGNDPERARVLWVKLRLKQEFPISFSEVFTPSGAGNSYVSASDLPPKPSYVDALSQAGITSGTGGLTNEQQSAVLLYLILSQKRRGMNFEVDKELSSSELVDAPGTPAGSLKMIVDAWGNPLAFSRWPTGSAEPVNAGQPQSGLNDAQDPRGTLANQSWATTSNNGYTAFITYMHALPAGSTSPTSYKLVPEVYSAGADKQFGVTQNLDFTDSNGNATATPNPQAFDNLYSYDKQLGKGA